MRSDPVDETPLTRCPKSCNGMVALVSGYVLVKVVAGIHAGYAARDFNRNGMEAGRAFVVPLRSGALAGLEMQF